MEKMLAWFRRWLEIQDLKDQRKFYIVEGMRCIRRGDNIGALACHKLIEECDTQIQAYQVC